MAQGYNLHQVVTLRDKLVEGLIGHIGTSPEGMEFEKFVDDLFILLPEGLKYGVIQQSVNSVLGREITKQMLIDTAWRLAGNLDKLKEDKVVYPWQGQGETEWMPVQVLAANRTKTWKGELGYNYKMRIIAGSACPIIFWKVWPSKVSSFIARQIGFSPSWKDHPYRDGHELVSMRFLVEIDPKLCRDNQPDFHNVNCPASMERWNKDILKARAHTDPPCPFGFMHFCYQCPVGYDQCMAGTHPKTYEAKHCSLCNEETWHDPGANNVCVACREAVNKST